MKTNLGAPNLEDIFPSYTLPKPKLSFKRRKKLIRGESDKVDDAFWTAVPLML